MSNTTSLGPIAKTPTDDARDATIAPTAISDDEMRVNEVPPPEPDAAVLVVLGRCAQSTTVSLVFGGEEGWRFNQEQSNYFLSDD